MSKGDIDSVQKTRDASEVLAAREASEAPEARAVQAAREVEQDLAGRGESNAAPQDLSPATGAADEITTIVDTAVETEPVADDAEQICGDADASEGDGSYVNMYLSAAGVKFKLNTKLDQSQQASSLTGQLELMLSLLSATQSRLESAFIRIGQLESELEASRELTRRLLDERGDG